MDLALEHLRVYCLAKDLECMAEEDLVCMAEDGLVGIAGDRKYGEATY